jgi:heme exporter protein A
MPLPRRGPPDSNPDGNSRGGGPIDTKIGPLFLCRDAGIVSTPPPHALLEARALSCTRGDRLVFRDLSFAVAAGQALTLRGPNGSGKSSLLRLLAGLLRPSAGVLAWSGGDIAEDRDAHRARVGYLGMLDALKPALTVSENIAFHATLRGAGADAVARAIAAMRLEKLAATPARLLSQGQRRRAALARLIAGDGALWLLDEPTLALDDEAIVALGTTLKEHLAGGGVAVIATHVDLPVASAGTVEFGAAR